MTNGDVVIGNDVLDRVERDGHVRGDGRRWGGDRNRQLRDRDVRPYAIVVGNPAREIRLRFDEVTIGASELCWWDWSDERIGANADLFSSHRHRAFIKAQSEPTSLRGGGGGC